MSEEACHLCLHTPTMYIADLRRPLRYCPKCDLVFAPTETHLAPEQEKTRYLQHNNSLEDEGYAEMLRRPIRLLRKYAPHVRTVLDYGCGPEPAMVTLLNQEGYRATGYDPLFGNTDSQYLTSAGGLPPSTEPNICASLDAGNATVFDAVVAIETFEHFADPPGELDCILAHLAPNGYLLIQTLLHAGPETFGEWWYARDLTHVAFYSHVTMAWIARNRGMEVIHLGNRNLTLLRRRGE